MRLEGKVAIISGGARGMGSTEARMFAKEGANVVFGDLRDDLGKKVEAEISESGGEAIYVSLDVTDASSWQSAVDTAVSRFGKLDILVNNAGIVNNQSRDEATAEEWDRVMDVNAKGVFLGTKVAIPEMRKAGGGSIVNISSISGMIGQHGIHPGYNASKGAVRLLNRRHWRGRRSPGKRQPGRAGSGAPPPNCSAPKPGLPQTRMGEKPDRS